MRTMIMAHTFTTTPVLKHSWKDTTHRIVSPAQSGFRKTTHTTQIISRSTPHSTHAVPRQAQHPSRLAIRARGTGLQWGVVSKRMGRSVCMNAGMYARTFTYIEECAEQYGGLRKRRLIVIVILELCTTATCNCDHRKQDVHYA